MLRTAGDEPPVDVDVEVEVEAGAGAGAGAESTGRAHKTGGALATTSATAHCARAAPHPALSALFPACALLAAASSPAQDARPHTLLAFASAAAPAPVAYARTRAPSEPNPALPLDDARTALSELLRSASSAAPIPPTLARCGRRYIGVSRDDAAGTCVIEIARTASASPEAELEDGNEDSPRTVTTTLLYDVLAPLAPAESSSIGISITWDAPAPAQSSSPPGSADVTLALRCVFGDGQVEAVAPLARELAFLASLAPNSSSNSTPTFSGPGISAKIDAFIQECRDEGFAPIEPVAPRFNGELRKRADLDFLERLWEFSRDTSSVEDLADAFTAVVEEIETKKFFPPLKLPVAFAQLIRDCLASAAPAADEGTAAAFDDVIDNPCATLFEIGGEKLRRDYFFLLGEDDLIPLELLTHVFAASPASPLAALAALHSVLELKTLVEANLPLIPAATLAKLLAGYARHAAQQLRSHDETTISSIDIEVPLPRYSKDTIKMVQGITRSYEPALEMRRCGGTISGVDSRAGERNIFYEENDEAETSPSFSAFRVDIERMMA